MKFKERAGFTLIELMVTMVLIGILSGGVFMMMRTSRKQAAVAKTTTQVHALAGMLEKYKNIYGSYPKVSAKYLDGNDDPIGYSCLEFHFVSREGDDIHLGSNSSVIDNSGTGLTFKIKDGSSTKTVRNARRGRGRGDEMTFGLCSHFLPRANTILDNTGEDSSEYDYYEKQFENTNNAGTPYGNENMKGGSGNFNKMLVSERLDTTLYDEWRRLAKEGIVKAGNAPNIETGSARYTAGADNDAWGTPLVYRDEGGSGEIVSAGPDKVFGTADDITSGGGAVDEEDDD